MDLGQSITIDTVTELNDAAVTTPGGPIVGCSVDSLDYSIVEPRQVLNPYARYDGLDVGGVWVTGRRVSMSGTIYGSSRGDAYDRLAALKLALHPTSGTYGTKSMVGQVPTASGGGITYRTLTVVFGPVRHADTRAMSGGNDADPLAIPWSVQGYADPTIAESTPFGPHAVFDDFSNRVIAAGDPTDPIPLGGWGTASSGAVWACQAMSSPSWPGEEGIGVAPEYGFYNGPGNAAMYAPVEGEYLAALAGDFIWTYRFKTPITIPTMGWDELYIDMYLDIDGLAYPFLDAYINTTGGYFCIGDIGYAEVAKLDWIADEWYTIEARCISGNWEMRCWADSESYPVAADASGVEASVFGTPAACTWWANISSDNAPTGGNVEPWAVDDLDIEAI